MRSLAAVIAAVMLLNFIDATFEQILVNAMAATPPADEKAFLDVRNQSTVLALLLVTHVLAALLVGYILARIAGAHEVRHALSAAAVIAVLYVIAFAADNVRLPPIWVRVAQLLVTPPALVAGAWVRREARLGITRPIGPEEPS